MSLLKKIFVVLTIGGMSACYTEKPSEPPEVTLGRQLFNSTKFDNLAAHTISCATCHPDGDMDGKKWFLPPVTSDTLSTPSLFGVAETAPYLWFGNGGSDLRAVTKTVIETILLGTATDEELDALTAYQLSLAVPANPFVNSDGSLTTAQQRGKSIFENQGKCIVCHSGPIFTARDSIQIRKLKPKTDIPSLRWVFATAPYFHDHAAADLRAVIDHYSDSVLAAQMTTWGWNDRGIFDINLSESEKADLLEYLKTL